MRKYLSMMFVLMLAATIGLSACAKKEERPRRRRRLRPPRLPCLPTTWHRRTRSTAPAEAPRSSSRQHRFQRKAPDFPGALLFFAPDRQEALTVPRGRGTNLRFSCRCPS